MATAPVVAQEVDGPLEALELVDQPVAIRRHRRGEGVRQRHAEAGRGEPDDVLDARAR